jgi:chromosome partitioning protein
MTGLAHDCTIARLDAPGIADARTFEVARTADAILIPSGLAVDDLLSAVRPAHGLSRAGSSRKRIAVALCRSGDARSETEEATRYIGEAGYHCLAAIWPERAGYRRAHDEGRVATAARHPSLRAKARDFATAAMDCIEQQTNVERLVNARKPAGKTKAARHASIRG